MLRYFTPSKIRLFVSFMAAAFFSIYSLECFAEGMVRGINYDPVHSQAFAKGIGTDDETLMQQSIFNDLDKLRDLENKAGFKITHLKTFFTQYNSLHNQVTLNIADTIYQWNLANPDNELTLALGVYEFRPKVDACTTDSECLQWTQSQIDAVKQALSQYNGNHIPLIDRIVVGNENLGGAGIDVRLTNDIKAIKQYLIDNNIQNVLVGTAQTQPTVMALYSGNDYQNVFDAADFIGVNFYPFWSNVPYGEQGVTAKQAFAKDWSDLQKTKNWGIKPVIETEEGWPSSGSSNASVYNQNDYFYYWLYGHTPSGKEPKPDEDYLVQTSYFFALDDKLPGQGIESNWGLFSADNSSNIFDNLQTGGKTLSTNIVFPRFNNYIGMDATKRVVHNLADTHKIIVTACTENDGQGVCYPLYGFQGSGEISAMSVNPRSWDPVYLGYADFTPGTTKDLMIDTSNQYYKSLLIVLNDGNSFPGICTVSAKSLQEMSGSSTINIVWPNHGIVQPCSLS